MQAQDTFYAPPCYGQLEAAWITWPHDYNPNLGGVYVEKLEPMYIEIVKALSQSNGLKVRVIVYNQKEKERLEKMLSEYKSVEFFIIPTDDLWIRDNGPTFVRDHQGKMHVCAWGFNGWGKRAYSWDLDSDVPLKMAEHLKLPLINLKSQLITEGGGHQFDGNGTMIITKSCVINPNRNPEATQESVEALFRKYYGIKKFIWLEGTIGASITDMHIDGYIRIVNKDTLFVHSRESMKILNFTESDLDGAYESSDINGNKYKRVVVPATENSYKIELDPSQKTFVTRKGSYLNFFKANNVVLMPIYNDPNDEVALKIFKENFPTETVVPIDVTNLYYYGGMLHCITQQQPYPATKNSQQ